MRCLELDPMETKIQQYRTRLELLRIGHLQLRALGESSIHKASDDEAHEPSITVDSGEDRWAVLEHASGDEEPRYVRKHACS